MPGPPSAEATAPREGSISVIVPTLNESGRIAAALRQLDAASVEEVIVVDGGSRDGTAAIAASLGATVLQAPASRGGQQNLGARHAKGSILLFLHADTLLPPGFADQIRTALDEPWASAGAFQFRLDASGWRFRLVERMVALRCRLLHLPYGDQALFVRRASFEQVGGFADLPAMEDFDLVRRLRQVGRIVLAEGYAVTSARRWRSEGVWRLTWTHQLCILGYYLRAPLRRVAAVHRTGPENAATYHRGGMPAKFPATLARLRPGADAVVAELEVDEAEAVRLMELGFIPDERVSCERRVPLGDLAVYRLEGAAIALRRKTAARIRIRRGQGAEDARRAGLD